MIWDLQTHEAEFGLPESFSTLPVWQGQHSDLLAHAVHPELKEGGRAPLPRLQLSRYVTSPRQTTLPGGGSGDDDAEGFQGLD
eukprot:s104_g5.t1